MALQTLNTIKDWFKTGLKPSQTQFWDTWDSFRHKDEKIPITAIDDIENILAEKADQEALQNHLTNPDAHADLFGQIKTTGRFLINRNNLMFFADEPIPGDTVTGMVESEYLNAGTFYGGNFELLSSYVDPDSTEGALFNISNVVAGTSVTFSVVAGTDKTIQYYIAHYSQLGEFISVTVFSLDQLSFNDLQEIEEYTYFYNAPGEGQISIEDLNEESISNLYVIPN
jgi:hypothetical protein